MRIVAVADTHLFHDELVVPDGDVFVHAGDLCRAGDLDELAQAARWIRNLPHPTKIVVAGNHDWCFASMRAEAEALFAGYVTYLQDERVDIGRVRFWGSPWQPAYNQWAFNLPRGPALAEKWALIDENTDVLVTHGPPLGHGDGIHSDGAVGGRHGCADLAARVRVLQPKLHLFGHIHQDGGAAVHEGIAYVNCTTWECERAPSVVDLDEATGAVTFVSIPPRSRSSALGLMSEM